ncbi:MAG: MotA/TolQ/ExbB proton channel family protein [Gammaproteobacteria bacterium]|nr:MotA/TolQ/ExbB proton channel family protein [Gammaproteobacteria bacterium]
MKPTHLLSRMILPLALMTNAFSAAAVTAGDLDALLEQTRTTRQAEARANAERESKFLAERNKQAEMMEAAKADLATQQSRSEALTTSFDGNEKQLSEMQEQLEARAGNLGEMFGVVRQVANDFSSVVNNSLISAQYPGRTEFMTKLAQSKSLPSMSDLERFWFELQQEMTETGKVVKYKSTVIAPEGEDTSAVVTRIGPFSATTSGNYMSYLPSQQQLAVMARQPGPEYRKSALELEELTSGYTEGVVDPTRGTLLSIYAQRPNVAERIEKGEAVGYVILVVGFIGAALGLYQLAYLSVVRYKVRNQMKFVADPHDDNPLGRVLATFKAPDTEKLERSADVVELRISEAVLKEVPRLERFQSFLKLAVAAGPLLGLIGTVIGMIMTFQSITESGSSDPKLMAAGISQAMIATVLGLSIAVPLLFLNAWLASISKSIVQVLDEQSAGLLAGRLELLEAESETRDAA